MDWCPVCCTRHASRRDCPGELLATGPERHGLRMCVTNGTVREVYGVLIAESGDFWRARIFTYPSMLWSVPGGRGTIKFVGDSPQSAQGQAVRFIQQHCNKRGYKVVDENVEAEPGAVKKESADVQQPRGAQDERHTHSLEVRFGEEKPTETGRTSNVSPCGLFITTRKLIARGRQIRMLLQVDQYTIPLVGTVAWIRRKPEGSEPPGMGIELKSPPAMYSRYVRKVKSALEDRTAGGQPTDVMAETPEPAGATE